MSEQELTVREVVDYLISITANKSQTWQFILRRDGSGEINSGGGVTDIKFSCLATLRHDVRVRSLKSAKKLLIDAAVALRHSKTNYLQPELDRLIAAVDCYESLGADD